MDTGQLSPDAAKDLYAKVDAIAKDLASDDPQRAKDDIKKFRDKLTELNKGGRLTTPASRSSPRTSTGSPPIWTECPAARRRSATVPGPAPGQPDSTCRRQQREQQAEDEDGQVPRLDRSHGRHGSAHRPARPQLKTSDPRARKMTGVTGLPSSCTRTVIGSPYR